MGRKISGAEISHILSQNAFGYSTSFYCTYVYTHFLLPPLRSDLNSVSSVRVVCYDSSVSSYEANNGSPLNSASFVIDYYI